MASARRSAAPVSYGSLLALAVLLGAGLAGASPKPAALKRTVIDGIVAVVDDGCITRSELARFIVPFERKVQRDLAGKPAEQAKAMERVRKESVAALIERRLLEREAARQHIVVTNEEVDAALAAVAAQNHIGIPELFAAALEQGLDEARYRSEIRGQIVEAKVLQRDAPQRFPDWSQLTPEARAERLERGRHALLEELRARAFVEIRL